MLWERIWVFAEAPSPSRYNCGWEKGLCCSVRGDFVSFQWGSEEVGCRGCLWRWWIVAVVAETWTASCSSVRGVCVTVISWAALPEIIFQQHQVNVSLVANSSTACQTLGSVVLIRERNQEFVWQIHLNSEHRCNMHSQIRVFWLVEKCWSSICWWTPAACAGIALRGERHLSLVLIKVYLV